MSLDIAEILGMRNAPREETWDYWVHRSREGLEKEALENLLRNLAIRMTEVSRVLSVSERTLQRYPAHKVLSRDLSGHIVAVAKIYSKATEVFEDQEKARRWLHKPCRALAGEIPLFLLDTPIGIQAVEDELTRIEFGVYA